MSTSGFDTAASVEMKPRPHGIRPDEGDHLCSINTGELPVAVVTAALVTTSIIRGVKCTAQPVEAAMVSSSGMQNDFRYYVEVHCFPPLFLGFPGDSRSNSIAFKNTVLCLQ